MLQLLRRNPELRWLFLAQVVSYTPTGSQALAYARIRKPAGESDFTRAERQQEVLIALRDSVVKGGFLNDPVGFLQAIGRAIRADSPPGIVRTARSNPSDTRSMLCAGMSRSKRRSEMAG